MKKNLIVIFMLMLSFGFLSCGENEENFIKNQNTVDANIKYLSSRLFDTNWKYLYSEFYNKDNGRFSHKNSDFANKFIFTFSDDIYSKNQYKLFVNGNSSAACWWYINEDGLNYSATDYGYRFANMSASEVGGWSACGGTIFDGYISVLSSSKLVLKDYYPDGIKYLQHVFSASSNSGNDTGGNSVSYEKPEVGFYDFTATKTSLKIQYKIYNKTEAAVSSARIYYGTTSNPSISKTATISGALIPSNITGLKSGTTYYVKCEVTGKGGKTITAVTKCITNY